ncbi:nucleotidyltransferase-like protein [Ancylomarina subtilis]|uniref:Nucleotidyltransferase-like protein n=1 Tax=Ancylomarina subtilis TaxID=1639035 RepID=A0A4Q7VK71_9BACT|nr:nucleotidyltransferase family protein [Ancylomarina subtilis]RZT96524.1 nucleotidyltransferase-like protein [Ancylomarina subtilis]
MINAMIFAAGLGTRLQHYTKNCPKALVKLNGKPLLEHCILKMKDFGVDRIVINVHHFADQIEDFLESNENFGLDIRISDERDLLLDTGGAIKKAAPLFIPNAPILIYNVDVLSSLDLGDLLSAHKQNQALATLNLIDKKTDRYLCFNHDGLLCAWKNDATHEEKIVNVSHLNSKAYSFSGIHIIESELLDLIEEEGVFSVIDLYLRLAKSHRIAGFHDSSDLWMDLGKPEELLKAETLMKK